MTLRGTKQANRRKKKTQEQAQERYPLVQMHKSHKNVNLKSWNISRGPGTDPCRPCACCFNFCELIWALVIWFRRLVLLVSSFPSGSYSLYAFSSAGFSEHRGERFDGDIPYRVVCCKDSFFRQCLPLSLCICSCLLQEASSLMMTK